MYDLACNLVTISLDLISQHVFPSGVGLKLKPEQRMICGVRKEVVGKTTYNTFSFQRCTCYFDLKFLREINKNMEI